MKKGSVAIKTALMRRGASERSLARWASERYGGSEPTWRTWLNDPSKIKVETLRRMQLSDAEVLDVVRA